MGSSDKKLSVICIFDYVVVQALRVQIRRHYVVREGVNARPLDYTGVNKYQGRSHCAKARDIGTIHIDDHILVLDRIRGVKSRKFVDTRRVPVAVKGF